MSSPFDRALAEAAQGVGPPNVMLMRVLGEAETEADARSRISAAIGRCEAQGQAAEAARLQALLNLWTEHSHAWQVVRSTLSAAAHDRRDASPEAVLARWIAVFDQLAAASPEAGVALYALGSPDLLQAASTEIITLADRLGLFDPACGVVDLGCGIGRLLPALADRSRHVLGLDISAGMAAEARRRCAHLANVRVEQGNGRDLGMVAGASVGLVLAVDVFPYLVQAGGEIADAHVAEFARVLRPGGAALVLNYSYRGDLDADRRDIARVAKKVGLAVERDGTADLTLWDGVTFLLRKGA